MSLGLSNGEVRLERHNVAWRRLYEDERDALWNLLGPQVLDIQHVGSTRIENIRAKPVIDILLGATSLDRMMAWIEPLRAAGYRSLGLAVVEGHHVFVRGARRTHILHCVEYNGPAWNRVILFRDILLRFPEVAAQYEAHKLKLGRRFRRDRAAYGDAKTPFIDKVLAEWGRHVD